MQQAYPHLVAQQGRQLLGLLNSCQHHMRDITTFVHHCPCRHADDKVCPVCRKHLSSRRATKPVSQDACELCSPECHAVYTIAASQLCLVCVATPSNLKGRCICSNFCTRARRSSAADRHHNEGVGASLHSYNMCCQFLLQDPCLTRLLVVRLAVAAQTHLNHSQQLATLTLVHMSMPSSSGSTSSLLP
jgi:hypothetical protein